jgi:hypothetical protein
MPMSLPAPASTPTTTQTQTSTDDSTQRQAQWKDAWDAFYGKFPKPLKVRPGQADDNVTVNECRPSVVKGVAMLFGKEVTFEVDAKAPRAEEAQDWLNKVWKRNKKQILLKKWATVAGVTGTGFLKVIPGQPYPRIVVQDTTKFNVQTAPDDVETPIGFEIKWTAKDINGQDQEYREVTLRAPNGVSWTIYFQHRPPKTEQWITDKDAIWPYPWAPIHWNQNQAAANSFWGLPDVGPDVVQINKDLNFLYTNAARILRLHAHPKSWIKGMNADQIKIAVDESLVLQNPNAEIGQLEMTSDLASTMNMILKLEQAIERLTQTPAITTGGNLDTIPKVSTGVGLTILHQPKIDQTMDKRETYGETLSELNSHLLELGGYGAGIEVENHWQDIMPGDDLALAQVLQIAVGLGLVSKQTASTKLGYNWDEEAKLLEMEAAQDQRQYDQGFGMDPRALQFGRKPPMMPPEMMQQQKLQGGQE